MMKNVYHILERRLRERTKESAKKELFSKK